MLKQFGLIGLAFVFMVYLGMSFTSARDNEFKITLIDERTNNAIKIDELKLYPENKVLHDEILSGEGTYTFEVSDSFFGLIVAKSEGFKTKYTFKWIKPYENQKIYLKPADDYEKVMKEQEKWISDEELNNKEESFYGDEKETKQNEVKQEEEIKEEKNEEKKEIKFINVK